MQLQFHKYQGTGNDFILLDNRERNIHLTQAQIALLCDRRFGIGADGLMLLETAVSADFTMIYYNSDGRESTMCGNGGRCITAFAKSLGLIETETCFVAVDGMHEAHISSDDLVRLQMKDVSKIQHFPSYALLDTGSPHYISWEKSVDELDVKVLGRAIRYRPEFAPGGLNVNFTHRVSEDLLQVRTYERGVEDETLSCGTGVTAAAIAASGDQTGSFRYQVSSPGGLLEVSYIKDAAKCAKEVWLSGPAKLVFSGFINLEHNSI